MEWVRYDGYGFAPNYKPCLEITCSVCGWREFEPCSDQRTDEAATEPRPSRGLLARLWSFVSGHGMKARKR